MFCSKCGAQIDDNARFCPECGELTGKNKTGAEAAETKPPIQGQKVTENIYLCPDGVYRWIYEFKMMKNPTVLFTIWKIFGGILLGVWVFQVLLMLIDGDFSVEGLLDSTKNIGIVALVLFVIGYIAYVIVAAQNGWKYIVLFEMDEAGVTHTQMQKQFEKAQALGWLTAMAGILTGNVTAVGIGIGSAVHNTLNSEFDKVKNIKVRRGRHTIYVNELLNKNQVYAEPADFDFVLDYITARLPADTPKK
ncbi:MAG: zinc ribbon domain-containing protein [Ruminiclostridium sp.]|nr:zinc ribbon domain-containing protein [Ruminiclostridium sp.]